MADDEPRLALAPDVEVDTETPDPNAEFAEKRAKDATVLSTMRKRFKIAVDGTTHFRENAILDTKFRAGTWGKKSFQWIEGIQTERESDQRPCLTINRAPGSVHQITNQARNAHLRIQVNPVDDHGDPKVAEVFQGIIRNIETTSFADRAYAMTSDKQAEIGLGVFRLITEWADQKSFRQRIKFRREMNPLSIYFDPSAQEADFSIIDGGFAFKVTDIDAETYKTKTGRTVAPTSADAGAFSAQGDETGDWFPNGKIRWVEYFSREPYGPRKRIAQLSNGEVIDYPDDAGLALLKAAKVEIVQDRWVQEIKTIWRQCTAIDVHEETVWPADSHPFFPAVGDELIVDGERDWRGCIRDSKDSARAYNVQVSGLVEAVGLGQKSPVVGYRGQFGVPGSDQRKAWETANRKPVAFLELELMEIDGKPAPFIGPVRFEPPISAIVESIHQTDEDYKTTSGWHDASLGERGPQESGKAIVARQRQDELGSSHFLDNLRFAMCAAGRQLIQLIRAVYDVPTVIRITGTDGRQKKVMVFSGAERDPRNAQYLKKDPTTGQPVPFKLPDGVADIFDLGVGEFDIEVSAGPSPGSRRQEATEAMTALFQGLPPEVSMKFLDLYFLVMDFPQARQMMERAKKLLPPELQDDDEGGAKEPIPPQVQMAMTQMKEQLGQAMQALQMAQKELQGEQTKFRAQAMMKREELQSRERIEAMKLKVTLLEQQRDISAERALVLLQAEIDRLTQLGEQIHTRAMADFEAGETDRDRQITVGLAAADADAAAAAAAVEGVASAGSDASA